MAKTPERLAKDKAKRKLKQKWKVIDRLLKVGEFYEPPPKTKRQRKRTKLGPVLQDKHSTKPVARSDRGRVVYKDKRERKRTQVVKLHKTQVNAKPIRPKPVKDDYIRSLFKDGINPFK